MIVFPDSLIKILGDDVYFRSARRESNSATATDTL